jgi:putative transposase
VADAAYTARELAEMALPGMPTTKRRITEMAKREGWPVVERLVSGNVAWTYPVSALPVEAQLAIVRRTTDVVVSPLPEPEKVPERHRDRICDRLRLVGEVQRLVDLGTGVEPACELVAATAKPSARSVRRWFTLVRYAPKTEWLALLGVNYRAGGAKAEPSYPEDLFACFRDDFLRPSKPTYAMSYRRTLAIATHEKWSPVPSLKSLKRRLEREVPRTTIILRREGKDAVERLYPAQERTRAHFGALGGVTADGHKFDVLVRWPGIKDAVRVMMVAYQDLYSGKILSWRVDQSEHANLARLALADLVATYGIPEAIWLDNGRAWASKKMTGGASHRFRFRVREEDAVGILPSLGVQVHFTTPYHGQAKPIERAFRDLCESVAKHPSFEGAYTGNNPMAKPSNYGTRVVELQDFLRVLEAQIREHNAREGRTAKACAGRSFDATFADSYASREIRKLSAAQERLLLLAAEGLTVRTATASIHMMGNRFWCEELIAVAGERVVARFDPHHMHRGIHVYRPDGRYIGFAECHEATGFDDADAAKVHAKKRREWTKAVVKTAQLEQTFHPDELGEMHLRAQGAPEVPPSARVIKPLFNAPATPPAAVLAQTRAELEERSELEDFIRSVGADAESKLRASNE